MAQERLRPSRLLLGDSWVSDYDLVIDGARIVAVEPSRLGDVEATTLEGSLVPGFFDIQVNGGGGVLFNDDPIVEAIQAIGTGHRPYGTTSYLPTLISDDLEKVAAAIAAVDAAIEAGVPGVRGIHIEGPFLNEAKRGIHDAAKFRQLDDAGVALLSSLKRGVTLVTLAPELADRTHIESLVAAGVVVSAGHTSATYEQAMAGVAAGVTGFTHLFNAMTGFESRAPGVVGAAFDSPKTWAGLIADGHHVHAAALRHAIRTKGIDKSILVTDAMPSVGSDALEFQLGGETIRAVDGRCTNADGVLAGSDLDMASAVRFAANTVGVGLSGAALMASRSPALFMGLDTDQGSLAVGQAADLVLLDDNIRVTAVWQGGAQQPL